MLRSRILVLISVALQALAASGAQADCLAPSPLLLWSYPEEGASDVPIDAELWAFTNLGSVRPSAATLNGQGLAVPTPSAPDAQSDGLHFSPGPLAANTAYAFVVTYPARGAVPASVFEVHFKTGADKAKPAGTAKIIAHAETPAADAALSVCKELFVAQGCSDTVGKSAPSLHTFELTSPGAVAWLVTSTHPEGRLVWPKTCGHPQLLVHQPHDPDQPTDKDKECFAVQPIGAGGKLARSVHYCSKPGERSRPLSAAAGSALTVRRPLEADKPAAPAQPTAAPAQPAAAPSQPAAAPSQPAAAPSQPAAAPAPPTTPEAQAPTETPKSTCACTVAGAEGPTPWLKLASLAAIALYRWGRRSSAQRAPLA